MNSAALPKHSGNGGPTGILRLLTGQAPANLAIVGGRSGDRLLVEDCWPRPELPGRSLRLPEALLGDRLTVLSGERTRLPLDWTQACGERPAWLASAPIAGTDRYLVMACCGATEPNTADMESAADILGQLLRYGQPTRRERDASVRIGALVENLPMPLVFVDSGMIELFLNDRARMLLGVDRDERQERAVATALNRVIATASDEQRALFAGNPQADMTLQLHHGGADYEVESRWIDEPPLTGRLWLFRDTTTEREVARFKDALVSSVSHELRTPLTSIVGSLGLLKATLGTGASANAPGLIDIALRNAERLVRLVNDLLDTDKMNAGKLEFRFVPTDLIELMREAIRINEPYGERLGVRLALALPDHPIEAVVDPDRLVQALSNLISNAAKFSPEGAVVSVALALGPGSIRISVADQGRGMSPEFQELLFTPFAQEGGAAKPGYQGTGLGLAITKTIVDRHAGSIAVHSQLGSGTIFTIELPESGPAA